MPRSHKFVVTLINTKILKLSKVSVKLNLTFWHAKLPINYHGLILINQLIQLVALQDGNEAPSPTPPSTPIFRRTGSDKRPPLGTSASGKDSQIPKSDSFKVKLHNEAQFIHPEEVPTPNSVKQDKSENDHDFLAARVRLRRVNGKE